MHNRKTGCSANQLPKKNNIATQSELEDKLSILKDSAIKSKSKALMFKCKRAVICSYILIICMFIIFVRVPFTFDNYGLCEYMLSFLIPLLAITLLINITEKSKLMSVILLYINRFLIGISIFIWNPINLVFETLRKDRSFFVSGFFFLYYFGLFQYLFRRNK